MKTIITLSLTFLSLTAICQAEPVEVMKHPNWVMYVDPAKVQELIPGVYKFYTKKVLTAAGKKAIAKVKTINSTVMIQNTMHATCSNGALRDLATIYYDAKGTVLHVEGQTEPFINYTPGGSLDMLYQWVCEIGGYTEKTGKAVFTEKVPTNVLDIGK